MSTFETLARELATRFDLGNQATPFLRMLMAHMTNPDKGGLPGFVQSLRSAGWNTLDSWLGRADQTTKIRGMFVHPGQVAEIVKRFPEVSRARLVVSGEMANDQMKLLVESAAAQGLSERVAEVVRDVTKLRGDVEVVAPGSLPNDGKVIEDARSYK